MGSRALPLLLVVAALATEVAGLESLSGYLVLGAVVGAGAAAFAYVGDWLAGRGSLFAAALTTCALAFVLLGSAVRASAAVGVAVPALGVSSLFAAAILYLLPIVAWVLEPVAGRARPVPS